VLKENTNFRGIKYIKRTPAGYLIEDRRLPGKGRGRKT